MVVRDACPECQANRYKKNGHTHTGKQNYQCKACGRQFVAMAEHRISLMCKTSLSSSSWKGSGHRGHTRSPWVFLLHTEDELTHHVVELLRLFIERHVPAVLEEHRCGTRDVVAHVRAALPREDLRLPPY